MQQRYKGLIHSVQKISGRYNHQQGGSDQDRGAGYNAPAHGSYGNLLFDPRWKAKRAEIITRDDSACVICRSENDLQVHHRQYHFLKAANAFRMPWAYPNYLLITLCKSCHQRGHSKYKVPTLII